MKIIHIVNRDPAKNVLNIIEAQRKEHDVEVINLESDLQDYDSMIDKILACDKLISWGNVHDSSKR